MDFNLIVDQVCEKHDLKKSLIMSSIRTKPVCSARHEAMHRLKEVGYTVSEIGHILKRDHTTVMNGINRHLDKSPRKRVKREKPKHTKYDYQLRKIGLKKGNMKDLFMDYLTDEVIEHCIGQSVAGGYVTLTEFFGDVLTDHYFEAKRKAE
jgi:hypothetical protein